MCKLAKVMGIAFAVAMALSASFVGPVSADEGQDQKALAAFEKGITLYETGDYAGARAAFDSVLAAQPSQWAALKMRDKAELGLFTQMQDAPELKETAQQILDLMTRAARERKRTVANPGKLLEDFQSPDLAVYGNARVELMGHGPYAVPYLLALLAQRAGDEQAVVARTISLLAQLQRDACLPLAAALGGTDDTLLQARIAAVLGQIGDARAVPALMALIEKAGVTDDAKAAAREAVQTITGKNAEALGSAGAQFADLGKAYFFEDRVRAGYTYGLSADIWKWDPSGADLVQKVVYEAVPNYLYYQRMATECALTGLASEPGAEELQALLAASLARQLALVSYFKEASTGLSGEDLDQQVKDDAAARAAKLEARAPIAIRLTKPSVVARALQMTVEAYDGPASRYLVLALADKLSASGPGALGDASAAALAAALSSGDKDVRYNAATAFVDASPTGKMAPANDVMVVLSAALTTAADRNALLIMDNFQMRNKLAQTLRRAGLATTESGVMEARIEYALSLQPSVDVIFLQGNISEQKYRRMIGLIKDDPRTQNAILYIVIDPMDEAAKIAKEDIEAVLTPDGLRDEALVPVLQGKVLVESRSAFTADEEQIVLKAARVLNSVDPLTTQYPLAVTEIALIRALRGYSEEVTVEAAKSLGAFGGEAAVEPLGKVVASDASVATKVVACRALAAVMGRAKAVAYADVIAVLDGALASQDQSLRQAAAEALSAAGLSPSDLVARIRASAMSAK